MSESNNNTNTRRCWVKICGICREEDVDAVCAAGADYVGFLVNIDSPRSNTPERTAALAARASIAPVLLFMDAEMDFIIKTTMNIEPAAVQLHGDESPGAVELLRHRLDPEIWKALHLPPAGEGKTGTLDSLLETIDKYVEAGADKILLDTVVAAPGGSKTGGTGKIHDWNLAAEIVRRAPCPVILAGGITPENAADAVSAVRPFALDLSSGVEASKGVKDHAKIRSLIERVKSVTL